MRGGRGGARARRARRRGDVEAFAHGMTVGTNALLEERGARTALVATRGFADLLEIGRQDRPHLYRLCAPKPAPLVEPELRFEAAERIGPDGVVEPLGEDEPERLAAAIAASGAESVAICLLFSYLDPSHERAHRRAPARAPARRPRLRLARGPAALPRVRALLDDRDRRLPHPAARPLPRRPRRGAPRQRGLPAAAGDAAPPAASPRPRRRRGPAPGASSPARPAAPSAPACSPALSGDGNALGFDMGGTSCDVCVVEDGEVRRTDSREIGGRPIQLPMVDVHTVGAGGGSIGWRDPGGALRVGPRSAGAEPGPACYGRGGTEPTVTDANLLLGHLAARLASWPAASPSTPRPPSAAVAALGRAASASTRWRPPPGSSASPTRRWCGRCAWSRSSAASTRAASPCCPSAAPGRCTRRRSPTSSGSRRILCPRAGGVLSALGLCASERRRDTARTVMLSGEELTAERIAARGRGDDRREPAPASDEARAARSSTSCATPARPSSCRCRARPSPTRPS